MLSQTDAKGNTTTQTYDTFNRCIGSRFPTAKDEHGNTYTPTVTFTYDFQGNLSQTNMMGAAPHKQPTTPKPLRIVQADGTATHHSYLANGTLAQTRYTDGTRCDYTYDIFQRITSKKIYSPEGSLLSSESWTYNTFHLLSYTDPRGLTTRYAYDKAGRKISEKAESRTITASYDPLGFLEKTTESEVAHVQIHDVGGRVAREWNETSDGRIENYMEFSYNADDQKTKAIRTTSQGNATDLFYYDREFRLTRHIDAEGNCTQFIHELQTNPLGQGVFQKTTIDPLGNQTIEIEDPLGRTLERTQKDPHGTTVSHEELRYDTAGNKVLRISTVYPLDTPGSRQIFASWEYDAMGRVSKETEGTEKSTHFKYDDRGRMTFRQLPSGVILLSTYDGIDRLLELRSSDGTVHYQYAYEQGPEPTEILDLVTHTSLYQRYNPFGQIVQETSPYGLTYCWEYNSHGQCTAYTLPDHSSIAYTYTCGHLTQVTRLSPDGHTLYSHRYLDFDPNGHVSHEELIHGLGTLQTSRDLLERPSRQNSPWLQQTLSYGPSSLVIRSQNSLLGEKTYAYDPLNQLTREGTQEYAFDSLGNPAQGTINASNQLLEAPEYTLDYDPDGNPLKKTTPDGPTTYTYDALGRLTSITPPDSASTHYFYDPHSRLIAEQTPDSRLLYLYDQEREIGAMDDQGILQLRVIGLGIKGEIGGTVAIELSGTTYAPLHDFLGNIIALLSPDNTIAELYEIDAFGREKTSSPPLNPWRFCSKRTTSGLIYFGQRFYDPTLHAGSPPTPQASPMAPTSTSTSSTAPSTASTSSASTPTPASPRKCSAWRSPSTKS